MFSKTARGTGSGAGVHTCNPPMKGPGCAGAEKKSSESAMGAGGALLAVDCAPEAACGAAAGAGKAPANGSALRCAAACVLGPGALSAANGSEACGRSITVSPRCPTEGLHLCLHLQHNGRCLIRSVRACGTARKTRESKCGLKRPQSTARWYRIVRGLQQHGPAGRQQGLVAGQRGHWMLQRCRLRCCWRRSPTSSHQLLQAWRSHPQQTHPSHPERLQRAQHACLGNARYLSVQRQIVQLILQALCKSKLFASACSICTL